MSALLNSHASDSFWVELTDEELFSGLCGVDDARRFEELVRRYHTIFARYLRKRFNLTSDMLEEAVQSTFARLWSARASYDPSRPFRPWAFCVAASQVANLMRANRNRRDVFSLDSPIESAEGSFPGEEGVAVQGEDPSSELERRELSSALRRALKRLPTRLRQAIELVFFQEMTFKGASQILNVTATTISHRVARGAALLRIYMLEGSAGAPVRRAAC